MENKNLLNDFALNLDNYLPALSVDCVILGYKNNSLHALVIRWKGTNTWSLPGGFVGQNEDIDQAALRILNERTGLHITFLEQLHVFGQKNRRNIKTMMDQFDEIGAPIKLREWFKQRFISVAYLALVNPDSFHPIPDALSDLCDWKPLDEMPQLIFDHNEMIAKATSYIAVQIKYRPIGLSLLQEKFTMKTLQKLYEIIIGTTLDRGNFQKKIIKLGFLIRHKKQMTGGAHKAPYLYSFDRQKYEQLLEKGINW